MVDVCGVCAAEAQGKRKRICAPLRSPFFFLFRVLSGPQRRGESARLTHPTTTTHPDPSQKERRRRDGPPGLCCAPLPWPPAAITTRTHRSRRAPQACRGGSPGARARERERERERELRETARAAGLCGPGAAARERRRHRRPREETGPTAPVDPFAHHVGRPGQQAAQLHQLPCVARFFSCRGCCGRRGLGSQSGGGRQRMLFFPRPLNSAFPLSRARMNTHPNDAPTQACASP